MKKLLVLFGFLFLALATFAATEDAGVLPKFNIATFFTTLAVFAGTVPVVTQFILRYINTKYDQVISWVVAIALAFIGWIFKLGIFEGLAWYWIIIYGAAAGLISNGIFDIPVINAILNLIPKKKLKE